MVRLSELHQCSLILKCCQTFHLCTRTFFHGIFDQAKVVGRDVKKWIKTQKELFSFWSKNFFFCANSFAINQRFWFDVRMRAAEKFQSENYLSVWRKNTEEKQRPAKQCARELNILRIKKTSQTIFRSKKKKKMKAARSTDLDFNECDEFLIPANRTMFCIKYYIATHSSQISTVLHTLYLWRSQFT